MFEYFRGKAKIERLLVESGFSYAILRPAVLFGEECILINNIAWLLRKLPAFGVFGDGNYRLQPIHVDDLARDVGDALYVFIFEDYVISSFSPFAICLPFWLPP